MLTCFCFFSCFIFALFVSFHYFIFVVYIIIHIMHSTFHFHFPYSITKCWETQLWHTLIHTFLLPFSPHVTDDPYPCKTCMQLHTHFTLETALHTLTFTHHFWHTPCHSPTHSFYYTPPFSRKISHTPNPTNTSHNTSNDNSSNLVWEVKLPCKYHDLPDLVLPSTSMPLLALLPSLGKKPCPLLCHEPPKSPCQHKTPQCMASKLLDTFKPLHL